jgi:hypothetical protein
MGEPGRLRAFCSCFIHPTAKPVCPEKVLMSLASTIGEAGFALRRQLGHLTPKTTDRPLTPGQRQRPIDAEIHLPFARQVFMDLQISGRPRASRDRESGEAAATRS